MKWFWFILYRSYRIASWLQYWTLRRYTLAGKAVVVGLLFTALFGFDIENTVTYQAFMVLFFALIAAFLGSRFFRARFSVQRLLPRFGSVGQSFYYRVEVKNLGRRRQNNLSLLEDLKDPRPSFSEWRAFIRSENRKARAFKIVQAAKHPFTIAILKEATVSEIPPQGIGEAHVEVNALRRGILRFNGVTLTRPDALGLMRAFTRVRAPAQILILPKRYPLPPIALPGALEYQEGGVALASSIGRSDEFVALRDYRRGDPLRHIHWRSWAKTGKPIVKEFEDEFFVRHALILDTFTDNPHDEVFEEAVSVAASFASTIVTQESLLDLLFVGAEAYCFTSGRGLAHADQMLEILAGVKACPDKPFSTLEHLVLTHISSVSGCVCVFVAWDDERRDLVKKIKSLGLPVMVLVVVEPGQAGMFDAKTIGEAAGSFYPLELGRIEQDLAALP
jgi:uncharacterized protein (DUF58 family)